MTKFPFFFGSPLVYQKDIPFRETRFSSQNFYHHKLGLNQEQCYERLVQYFEDSALSRATIFNWFV